MNILLTSLMVPGAPSGVRVHYERLAEQLRQQGHTVTVITQDNLRPGIRKAIGAVRRGLKLVLGKFGLQLAIELGSVAEIYFAIDHSAAYDVVNAQDVSSGWAARLAFRDRVPVVVTGHFNDHPAEELIHQQGFKGVTAGFLHRWYNFLLSRTRYFIGVSDYVLQRTLPWLPADALHTVVYNGVDMAKLARPAAYAAPTDVPDLRAIFPGRKIVLNIGHLEPRKNQRYLVRVAAELRHLDPSFLLVLVGQGEDEAILKQMIAEAKLEQNVVLLGYHRNVVALLHAADLYVHAATRENCPLVLLESMAAGCPAVALAVGGIPELLASTPDALVPVTTEPAVMAQHLGALLASPDALNRMQQQQHKFGKIQFDASTMVVRTVAFFEQARQHQQPVPDSTIGQTTHAAQPSYLEALPSAKEVG